MIYHGDSRRDPRVFDMRSDLDDLPATVREAVRHLKPVVSAFDSIVVTGMSGVIVGVPVALRLGKPVVIVRKPEDIHHNFESIVNEHRVGERWLWLDDFVGTGNTRQRVRKALDARPYVGGLSRCVGCYLYCDGILKLGDDAETAAA